MDLSFARFEADIMVVALPPDLAVLMVGVAARQAASPTAMIQANLPRLNHVPDWFAPAHGAFNLPVADILAHARSGTSRDKAQRGKPGNEGPEMKAQK